MGSRALNVYAQILAGGTGTRLWPYSRRSHPKQLLSLFDGPSLLQATVARLESVVAPGDMYVLTNSEFVADVRAQLPEVPPYQVIGEPEALGTAPAAALGAALVRARDPSGVLVVLPADHFISPPEQFAAAIASAARVAADGWLVTFGVRPTRPETGYGYIEMGDQLPGHEDAYRALRFVEKPDAPAARAYAAQDRFVWNSGIFAWTAEGFYAELARQLPRLHDSAQRIEALAAEGARALDADGMERLRQLWSAITDRTTIDYGIMEGCERVACVPAAFEWSDVGSWAAVHGLLQPDQSGNRVVGQHAGKDTRDCLVYGRAGRLVATIGVSDLIVVDTPDALLVCPRDRAQEVKAVVDQLAAEGRVDVL